jgi:NADH-quinone oxidoreductase subunit N
VAENTSYFMRAILPEIMVLVLIGFVLLFDVIWKDERKRNLGWLTFGGLFLTIAVSCYVGVPETTGYTVWGNMLGFDLTGFIFNMIFLFGAAITSLLVMDCEPAGRRGEFYSLMLVSTIGMMLMASSYDLVMLFLAIETTSIPLYILAGFLYGDNKSTEAGFKYLFFGALTSAIMLYGFSLLYGFGGSTNIYNLSIKMQFGGMPDAILLGSMLLILVGFAFKTSIVPLHFWAPDTYEGAPTPVAGFLSTASKAAGFAVLMRVFYTLYSQVGFNWGILIAILAVFTMTLGNLLAIGQKNIKRLLAYSSIAHAGYVLVGLVAVSPMGVASVVFYLGIYLVTNLAAFGVAVVFFRVAGSDDLAAYAGLSRRAPALGLVMLIAFLSLAGMPPFGGFVAKVWVFTAALQQGWLWLVVVGILNSIIGLYYYLRVLNVVYHHRSESENLPMPVTAPNAIALALLTIFIILLGVFFTPFFNISALAGSGWF